MRSDTGTIVHVINYTKIYATQLAGMCHAGEQMVDVASVMYNSGRERLPNETSLVSFDVIEGLSVDAWEDAALEAIQGLTLDVRRGHMAAAMSEAASSVSAYIALTTRRLIVLEGLQPGQEPRVLFSAGLDDVAVLTHDPRFPLEMGRILVGFRDGSLVRLWMGVLNPFAARRFSASFKRLRG